MLDRKYYEKKFATYPDVVSTADVGAMLDKDHQVECDQQRLIHCGNQNADCTQD